jgi:hypothetical protein
MGFWRIVDGLVRGGQNEHVYTCEADVCVCVFVCA